MSDPKQKERDGVHKAIEDGIKEANGQMSDHEFVLIKRAKKLGRKAKRAVKDALGSLVAATPGADTVRKASTRSDEELEEMGE